MGCLVMGHVVFPRLSHSWIAFLSYVWPVSRVTGSPKIWPVIGQTKSLGGLDLCVSLSEYGIELQLWLPSSFSLRELHN